MFSKLDTNKVKGLAIILMVFHHCFLSPARYAGQEVIFAPFSESSVNSVALSMKVCVAIFTFLSGYGIAISYSKMTDFSRKSVLKNVFRRWRNLILPFIFIWVLLNLYSLVMGIGWYTRTYGNEPLSILYAAIDALGLAQIFGTPTFISTFWYMSLAQIIVVVFPLLYLTYKKLGAVVLMLFATIFSVLFLTKPLFFLNEGCLAFFPAYIIVVCLGLICGDKNLLVKIKDFIIVKNVYINIIIHFVVLIGLIIAGFCFRPGVRGSEFIGIFDAAFSLVIILFMFEFINNIPIVKYVFYFLGIHSMTIFLIHNFIRTAWYYHFTYSFKNAYLITLVLLSISLAVAVVIDFAYKKIFRIKK